MGGGTAGFSGIATKGCLGKINVCLSEMSAKLQLVFLLPKSSNAVSQLCLPLPV